MKLLRLNAKGIAHYAIPLLIIVGIAVVGTGYIVASHADTPTTTATTGTTTLGYPKNAVVLDYQSANPGSSQGQSTVPYLFVGTKTVNYVATGQTLTYYQGYKNASRICYLVYVQQPKAGTVSIPVEFATDTNYVKKTLYSQTSTGLQEVCVNAGTRSSPGFNIKNLGSTQENITLEVYEAIVSY